MLRTSAPLIGALDLGIQSIVSDYFTTENPYGISDEDLKNADREDQIDVMRVWFRQRYEDPAQRTPYESAEGGYIWIWGGPYGAKEALQSEFYQSVPEDVIDELVEKLEFECVEWAPTPNSRDYDNYLFEDIARITEYYHQFSGAISDIESLLETAVNTPAESCLLRLLYVNVITAIETYLSDAFINSVAENQTLMRRLVESTPEFKSERIPLSQIYSAAEEMERRARSYLVDVVWHHLDRANRMYKETLNVSFPSEMGELYRAVMKRHDIVHRNGRTKAGHEIVIGRDEIRSLIEVAEVFVQHIDKAMAGINEREIEDDP